TKYFPDFRHQRVEMNSIVKFSEFRDALKNIKSQTIITLQYFSSSPLYILTSGAEIPTTLVRVRE
ncbi:hypothetical protein L9F63_015589, partial [Diploptera punctata]